MFDVVILTVIPELTQNEFDIFLQFVSPRKQDRIKQFRFFRDARNCLLGEVLSRFEICRITGLSNEQLIFSANAYGKPFLISNSHIHFNVSHAGYYIACAVADEPVGIDIEIIKSVDLKIAERFFTPDEVVYITIDNHERRFYEVWTKKESRIKWEGKGLHIPLTSFSVFELNEVEQFNYHGVLQNDEAICHICSKKQMPPSIRIMDTAAFLQNIMSLNNSTTELFESVKNTISLSIKNRNNILRKGTYSN